MGHAIPRQHPSVVLRSHFNLVRALLAVAAIAIVGLTVTVVILANDGDEVGVQADAPALNGLRYGGFNPALGRPDAAPLPQQQATADSAVPQRRLDGAVDTADPLANHSRPGPAGTRYDGGPEEGTRGAIVSPSAPGTRYDGGPEEGTRGQVTPQSPLESRYDGGPEEGAWAAGH
jgi:hypothetical protein